MRKNIKLFKSVILFLILLLTSSKAELTNKIIVLVGKEIVTNYDIDREKKYLSVITVGQFKNFDKEAAEKIAIDSLIEEKVKANELANHGNITISNEMIDHQIAQTTLNIGFKNVEDFKNYIIFENYKFDEFEKKILLELKWNQLVYQFYKNQIVVDKEKIDKKLKKIISEQKKKEDFLLYEIFIEDSAIKKLNNKSEEISSKNKTLEVQDEIIIEVENASYDNKENIVDKTKSIEEVVDVKINNKITIDELIINIKEKGFKNTAIKFSSSPTSKQEGKLGWINESEISETLLKSIRNLEIGKITKPISVPGGILILKVENRKFEDNKIDFNKKTNELVQIEKNKQLVQFSINYFNQVKNNIKIKYINE